MGGWINLGEAEQNIARYVADRRYAINRKKGVYDGKIGPQSNEATDIEGIGAEIAFCKSMNLYPDLTLDGHPPEDAVTHDGRRVDIKATKYKSGHLLAVVGKKNKPADVYALVIGTFPRYRIAGTARGEDLFKDENIKDFGYGNTYAMRQEDLEVELELRENTMYDLDDAISPPDGQLNTTKSDSDQDVKVIGYWGKNANPALVRMSDQLLNHSL